MIEGVERKVDVFGLTANENRRVTCVKLLVILASISIFFTSLIGIYPTLTSQYPVDMWEASTLITATRVSHGENLYADKDKPGGIQPPIYTPLQTIVLSWWVPYSKAAFWPGRAINVVAGLLIIATAFWGIWAHFSMATRLAGVALLVAANSELTGIWSIARNDAVPLCLGFFALLLMHHSFQKRRWETALFSALLISLAFWWKQTAVVFILVPGFYVLLTSAFRTDFRRWILAALPAAMLFSSIFISCLLTPKLFEVIIMAPLQFHMQPRVLLRFLIFAIGGLNFYWILLVWSIVAERSKPPLQEAQRWALALIIISTIPAFMAASKIGGGGNSFVYCFHALVFLVLPVADRFFTWVGSAEVRLSSALTMLGIVLINFVVLPLDVIHTPSQVILDRPYGDSGRLAVVTIAKKLHGKIVSPQDPTLAYNITGYLGTSLVDEWDVDGWKWPLKSVMSEIDSADYVITFGKPDAWQRWPFEKGFDYLHAQGFVPLAFPELQNSAYQIWGRPGGKSVDQTPTHF